MSDITKMSDREIKDYLKKDRGQYAIYWCTEDVIMNAEERDLKIPTEEQAKNILESCLDYHDCNYGMTWELLADVTVDEMKA